MEPVYLKPSSLAVRWGISITTLAQWRWNGKGPRYHKISGHVTYLLPDIEEFERRERWNRTGEYPKQGLNTDRPEERFDHAIPSLAQNRGRR